MHPMHKFTYFVEKNFQPAQIEEKLYKFWEENGFFAAKIDPAKKPFCIVLPPPNANASLHLGHAMYVYEDVMIRFQKMQGKQTFWIAGADHAGIETQFVYEKHLKKEGKSRFDFPRDELFQNIWDFVMANKETMENQLRRLGFSLDWSKKQFTMDPHIVEIVHTTFVNLFKKGLIYRANRLVNYCTHCGTSYSDLEVENEDTEGHLYLIEYPLVNGEKLTIATTRPETLVGDVAVMVNPNDKRYKQMIGQQVVLPLVNRHIPIIADEYVDMKFGTGAVKVTPAHDFNDFEIGKKHGLESIQIIGFDGKMQNNPVLDGMRVPAARQMIVEQLTQIGALKQIKKHKMVLKKCYRCKRVLEPLPKEQWFINVKPLVAQANRLVDEEKIQIYPKRFKKQLKRILDNFIDWNISRQIVWGIRIPAFYNQKTNKWLVEADPKKQKDLLQDPNIVQDEDTFDTWFSSGQWPFATLKAISQQTGKDFYEYFYPTAVMETGHDILRAWVARMIMLGDFATDLPPFENVFLHGMVRDKQGQKMSKSKGNVINPLEMVDKYGADALRASLIFGTKEGSDVVLSEDKIRGMRNFANKIWNIGRFLKMNAIEVVQNELKDQNTKKTLLQLAKEMVQLEKKYSNYMQKFQFAKALELLHQFIWHRFADFYIEELKDSLRNGNIDVQAKLEKAYFAQLRMLHPYMPFVTDSIWQVFKGEQSSILQEIHY